MTISHPRVEWKSELFCKEAKDVTRKWSIINEMVRRERSKETIIQVSRLGNRRTNDTEDVFSIAVYRDTG